MTATVDGQSSGGAQSRKFCVKKSDTVVPASRLLQALRWKAYFHGFMVNPLGVPQLEFRLSRSATKHSVDKAKTYFSVFTDTFTDTGEPAL